MKGILNESGKVDIVVGIVDKIKTIEAGKWKFIDVDI